MPVIIPVFVGLSLEEAQAALREQGMKLKKVDLRAERAGEPGARPGARRSGENILDEEGMVLFVGGPAEAVLRDARHRRGRLCAVMSQEMEEKHIKHTVTSTGARRMPAERDPEMSIPPRTIFSDDDVLELQTTSGG